MTNINFNSIRTLNGKQDEAFEELVCQLARSEKPLSGIKFIRKGKPDAGVECFWQMKNNSEWAWQAKYFLNSLTDTQWSEIDKSVKTVIDKHPKLKKYYIAIPVDMPDARLERKKSMLQKWNDRVLKWKALAQTKKMNVEFIYWGLSDLIERLSKKEQEGRIYFWFSQAEFTDDWIKENIQQSTQILLNKRYTPEINFDLPITKIFDGLSRDEKFKSQLDILFSKIINEYKSNNSYFTTNSKKVDIAKIISDLSSFKNLFKKLSLDSINNVDFFSLETSLTKNIKEISAHQHKLYMQQRKAVDKNPDKYKYTIKPFNKEIYYLRKLNEALQDFKEFIDTITCYLVNSPFLILEGRAGSGKSHLLADIVNHRLSNGHLSIFLLGQHFTNDDNPWTQILNNQLRLHINEHIFLGALNAKAESTGKRLIIFIDALNEGIGKNIWPDALKNFVDTVKKYEWLGLVVSIRTSYTKLIAPINIISEDKMPRLIHKGFEGLEYEAVKHFFKIYKIELPTMPLLQPELQNPLFLKLLCEGLHNKGVSKLPDGFWGITQSLDFFIESINEKLSKPNYLDYSSGVNPVKKTIDALLSWKIENKKRYIPYENAFLLTQNIFKAYTTKGSNYLDNLVSEGLFSEDLFWDSNTNKHEKGVYLAYERFEDHLFAAGLIDKYLLIDNPSSAFNSGYLNEITQSDSACNMNQGIIEALSVQLPEKLGAEFYELVPHTKKFYSVAESFVDSLIWRQHTTLSNKILPYINDVVLRFQGTKEKFWETLISVSIRPNHFLNAEMLHQNLMRFKLGDRDAWWTIYLHNKFDYETSVKRLIDWAWLEEDKSFVSDEVIRLTCITLAWFHTSSNRYLRDSATKGLVSLLENRIHLIIQVLKKFEKVNDPYVYERIFAASYGAVLRSVSNDNLKELSEYIFTVIFNKPKIYPNILLRDYARGIIEYTLYNGVKLNIKEWKIQPPYKSDLPNKFPTNAEIDKKYSVDYKSKNYRDYHRGQNAILSSMTTEYGRGIAGYGDFGRYTFQRGLYNFKVNSEKWSNWAVERIFKMGYDGKKHGEFDSNQSSGRGGSHKERIGKKYQWISFYEALARVADNFALSDESSYRREKKISYQGPWYPYVRDIDPTILITKTNEEKYRTTTNHWWIKDKYLNWQENNVAWMKKTSDLPNAVTIISSKDNTKNEWLMLEGHPEWDEPKIEETEEYNPPHKRIWYQIRSYIIKNETKTKILNWAQKQNFWGRWMSEAGNLYQVFSREYYWSKAFQFFQKTYYGGEIESEIYHRKTDKIIGKVFLPTSYHLWEEEFDCSKEQPISFIKPSDFLFKGLKVKQGNSEGQFVSENNELVCFDPCIEHKSFSCLLVKKKPFIKFLKENNLSIFWTVIGEKQILGNDSSKEKYTYREISGFYQLDDKNGINGKLSFYKI